MGIPRSEVLLPARLSHDLGFDTFDMNIFLFFLEARFNIEIYDNDIPKLQTIDNTINFIEEKLFVA
ncbi:MAG: acyl carrier protein [Salinivirgaceae bacterium]|nr:acyl carrier protein [Salinivirgaceae bacterium]